MLECVGRCLRLNSFVECVSERSETDSFHTKLFHGLRARLYDDICLKQRRAIRTVKQCEFALENASATERSLFSNYELGPPSL